MKSSKIEPIVTRSSRSTKSRIVEESPPKVRNIRSSPSRSPGRRKLSPVTTPKSSGRRSPARRSPARRSPARKSPSRKSPKIKEVTVPKSPSKRSAIKLLKTKDVLDSIPNDVPVNDLFVNESTTNGVDLANKIRASLRERNPYISYETSSMSRRLRTKDREDSFENMQRLAQNTALPKNDKSFDKSENGNISEDETPLHFFETRKLITPNIVAQKRNATYMDSIVGALLIVSSPLPFIVANVLCSNQPCTFTEQPNLSMYTKLESWINIRSALIVFCFFILNALTMLIPYFGRRTIMPDGKSSFIANGVFSTSLIITLSVLVNEFYVPIYQIVYDDFVPLTVCMVLSGSLLASATYIKARRAPSGQKNPHGNIGSVFYDYFVGKETNTTFFKYFHVKVLMFRLSLCGLILVNFIWMYRSLNVKNLPAITSQSLLNASTYENLLESITLQPTLLVFCLMQMIYGFDTLLFESGQMTTFEFQYEGIGYMACIGFNIYAVFPTLLTKRIHEHNIVLPNWALVLVLALFFIGFFIYRSSNSQKDLFRQNPLNPKIAHLESISTFHGKHILVGGWWGFVRHPNYLGDLILHTAWAIGTYNAIPIYSTIITYGLLIHRVRRVELRCGERYGPAWKLYCLRVPYNLIPGVY
ncbi:lamin B receptor [Arctopsyche grandis]|uniref:lamin B receptor n=1 Tax=Arctopsyche grandis TaxID=121162 RepID=UPI00406D8C9F